MATIRVSTRAQLDTALAKAIGGDTILLANGDYGDLSTSRDFATTVTLRSENPLGANFGKVGLWGATGIAIEGIEVENGLRIEAGSSNISVRRVDVDGTLYLRGSANILVEDSRIHDGQMGITLLDVKNFVVRNNDISGATEDLMRVVGNSFGGLIEGNFIHDPKPAPGVHPDCIQIFGSNSGVSMTPHDIIIRQNHLYALDDASGNGGAQGIFIADARTAGGFKNLLIEENLIQVDFYNALYVNHGTENVQILNNTLMSGSSDGAGNIRVSGHYDYSNAGVTIDGNVAKAIIDGSGDINLGDNHVYGRGANLNKLFQGGSDSGADWKDFLPVKGSPIDLGSGYGAEDLLAELSGAAATAPTTDTVSVKVSGDAWRGDPTFALTVNGVTVDASSTVTADHKDGEWQTITFQGDLILDGSDRIGIRFLNDRWGGTAAMDRNLYVDEVRLNDEVNGTNQDFMRNGIGYWDL